MRKLCLALVLAAISTAATAQFLSPVPVNPVFPRIINLHDSDGKVVGTGALLGKTMTLRDNTGALIGTVVFEADRKKTFFDPNGNVVSSLTIAGPPIKLPDEP